MRSSSTWRLVGLAAGCLVAACSPEPFTVHEPEAFHRVVPDDARVRRLAGGMPYVEGPVWLPDEGALVFSAMQADELKRWRPGTGLDVFRAGAGRPNGNVVDATGHLITCEHATRRVSRTLADGTVVSLVERYEGQRFSSPNDVAVHPDGSVWFTDPPYGLTDEEPELEGNFVFRCDPTSGELRVVLRALELPNGIAFAPGGETVYVTDSGTARSVLAFEVVAGAVDPARGRELHRLPGDGSRGEPDGLAVATDGTLFVAVGDGLDVLTPAGTWLGTIRVSGADRPVRNVCFGGPDGRTLFLTAGSALCAVDVALQGQGRFRPR